MSVWIICEKKDNNTLKAVGVFEDPSDIVSVLPSGIYIGIPIELNKLYDVNIIDEGMSGAVTHISRPTEISEQLTAALDKLTSLDDYVRETMVPVLMPLVQANIPQQLSNLSDRISALEGS